MSVFSKLSVPQNERFHIALWLWLPILLIMAKAAVGLTLSIEHMSIFVDENGIYEFAQVFILIIAIGAGLYTLIAMDKTSKWLIGWIALAALCCIYVAGEEVSWGQHLLKWGTPEFWQSVNDQGETNLHNTSSWLDQKPRLLLTIGVYVGGLIIPLLIAFKKACLPQKFEAIYPHAQFMAVALICIFIKISDKIQEPLGADFFWRNAEIEELFLYYFVFLYLLLMKKRFVAAKTSL